MKYVKALSTPVSPYMRQAAVAVEEESKLRDIVTFACPHCDGTIQVCEDGEGDAIFIHTLPFCDWFELANAEDLKKAIDENTAAKSVIERFITNKG